VSDPGETDNIAKTAPMDFLRRELAKAAKDLGLDLSGYENPEDGVNAMMAVDGTIVMAGGIEDNDYWAYGADAEKIVEEKDGGNDTLWYMAGPDDYVLRVPANIENIRVATVVSRHESDPSVGKVLRIIAHPDSPLNFETSERVSVDVIGSHGDDVMIGPKYAGAVFHGGAGNDRLVALSRRRKDRHQFFGGEGDDILIGGAGNDVLDGGSGNDTIYGGSGRNEIFAGPGNDRIFDGEGGSMIDTGPGRNLVISEAGDDVIHVGVGENLITGGPGAVTYHIAYGGLCIITDWSDQCVLELSAWPKAPKVRVTSEGVILRLGSSVIVLKDVDNLDAVSGRIKQDS
ncbi:sulfatase, partial [Marinosulfonomonas sp. PRT-SC04]